MSDQNQPNQNAPENVEVVDDQASQWEDMSQQEDFIVVENDQDLNEFENEIFNDEENDEEHKISQDDQDDGPPDWVAKYSHHKEPVYSIAVNSANPRSFATGGGDDIAVLWNQGDTTPAFALAGHTDSVISVQFNFDGKLLATGSMDSNINIWSAETGKLMHTLSGASAEIEAISWHKKGNALLAASADNSAWLWDANKGVMMTMFNGHSDSVTACSFSGDGKKVVTASTDASVRVWNPNTGENLNKIHGFGFHDGGIVNMVLHPTRTIALTSSTDRTACLSNYDAGKKMGRTLEHGDVIEGIAFLPEFDLFATGSLDGHVRLFDLHKISLRETVSIETGVTKIVFNEAKKLVLLSSSTGPLIYFDHRESQKPTFLRAHDACINDFALSGEDTIFTVSEDKQVLEFDLRKLVNPL